LSLPELTRLINDQIFGKELVEKWLEFYKYQLKRDLSEEREAVLNRIGTNETQVLKASMSILDNGAGATGNNGSSVCNPSRKSLKSKTLFDSIRMLLLLMNKTNRLLNELSPAQISVMKI
jgi:hypothetical protein